MTACQARLDRRLVNGPAGWPEYEYQGHCTQTVGVAPVPSLAPGRWAACSRPGHREDVLAQVRVAEARQRARHEHEQDARAEALAEVRADERAAAWLDDEREPIEPLDEAYG